MYMNKTFWHLIIFYINAYRSTFTADAVTIVAHNDNNNIYIKINIKIGPSIININNGNQPSYYNESQYHNNIDDNNNT